MSVDQHRLRQDLTVYAKCPYFLQLTQVAHEENFSGI